MRRVLTIAGLAVALAVTPASPCWACRCVEQTAGQHAANADVIFTGHVVETEHPFEHSGARVQASFEVERVHKGAAADRLVVETFPGGTAACGWVFGEGERYTVFAFTNERGRLETNTCSATTKGDIDPARFGLDTSGEPADPGGSGLPVGAFLGALAALGVGVGLALNRRSGGPSARGGS